MARNDLSHNRGAAPTKAGANGNAKKLMLSVSDRYTPHVRQFVEWLGEYPVTQETVVQYIRELNERTDYAASTKAVKRQAIKRRLRDLKRMGGMGSEFSQRIDHFLADLDTEPDTKAPKTATDAIGSEHVLSESEYHQLLEAAAPRLEPMLRFLWTTGARVSEMTGILNADVTEDAGEVRILLRGKGAKERTVKIPPELLERIRAAYRGDRYLFETQHGRRYDRSQVSNDIKRLGRRILGRRISAHTFRHTFATRMIEKTGKTEAVSRYLGHASPSITLAMYVHQSLDSAELFG